LLAQQRATAHLSAVLGSASDRALAFDRAFGSSQGSGHTAIYGAGVGPNDPTDLVRGFGVLRGRLPFPIPGRSEIRTAKRRAGNGPGLQMQAPVGTAVRAVYAGRVAFADEYADYGRAVILDHGDSYYTVSANLAEIDVAAGDDLPAGSRLGAVGTTSYGTGLFFEVRRGDQTFDPADWFGI
jgi:septal ring factor EnvC (AmiA/AmiB activator)